MKVRELLLKYIEKKKKEEVKYSLTTLAKETGVSKTTLSGFLNSTRVPNKENLYKIVKVITNNKAILEKYKPENSKIKIKKYRKKVLSDSLFREISDWEYFAILGLSRLKDNSSQVEWISKKLNIAYHRAETCFKKLKKEKLIKIKNGSFYKDYKNLWTTSGVSNKDIKKAHSQAINLSEEAMYSIDIKYRQYLTTNITIKEEALENAKEELETFLSKFFKKYNCEEDADILYKLNLQFFPLSSVD